MQNFHPLFVHFPIGLLFVATLAAMWAQANPGAQPFARTLLYLGTVAAAGTVVSGFLAGQSVARVKGAHAVIEEHERYAYILLGVAALLSSWSIVSWRRRRASPTPAPAWLAANAVLLALVVLTAKEGGELVHELGVGTKLTAPGGPLYDPTVQAQPADSSAPRPTGKDFR